MQKQLKPTTNYALNEKTKMKVLNINDGESYKATVSLVHKLTVFRPLEFNSPKEIADFFAGIDYEEEQQSLLNETPSERLIKLHVRQSIYDLFTRVENGNLTANEAMDTIDEITKEWIGPDDTDTYPFPANWNTDQRKNWVHSRNHMRRQLRSEYAK